MIIDPPLWDMASAITGGVIGALAGGIPAWLIARSQAREVSRRDEASRLGAEKAAAHRTFVKLLMITNSVHEIHTYIEGSIASAAAQGHGGMETLQRVQPMIGFSDEGSVQFDAEEASIFISAGERDYLTELLLLGRRHAALIATMQAYSQRREEYRAVAPIPTSFNGSVGVWKLAKRIAEGFGPILQRYFKDPVFPSLVVPD